jgi:hypothetical protein
VIRRVEAEERDKRASETSDQPVTSQDTSDPHPNAGVKAQGMQLLDQDEADALKPVDALVAEMVEGSQSGTVGAAPLLAMPYPQGQLPQTQQQYQQALHQQQQQQSQQHGPPVLNPPPVPGGSKQDVQAQRGSSSSKSKSKSGTSGGSKRR